MNTQHEKFLDGTQATTHSITFSIASPTVSFLLAIPAVQATLALLARLDWQSPSVTSRTGSKYDAAELKRQLRKLELKWRGTRGHAALVTLEHVKEKMKHIEAVSLSFIIGYDKPSIIDRDIYL